MRAFAGRITLQWLVESASYALVHCFTLLCVLVTVLLHVASVVVRVHQAALSALHLDNHVWVAFAFVSCFPFLVATIIPWAPPWAPICLWHAFLLELFAMQGEVAQLVTADLTLSGSTAMVVTARVVIPLLFLSEGLSHHSFLLDLSGTPLLFVPCIWLTQSPGGELLVLAFVLSAVRTTTCFTFGFLPAVSLQIIMGSFLPNWFLCRWLQFPGGPCQPQGYCHRQRHEYASPSPRTSGWRSRFSCATGCQRWNQAIAKVNCMHDSRP